MKSHTITKENVRSLFNYDAISGYLTWSVLTNSRAPIGSRTGTVKKRGYRQFKFMGRDYYEHVVIWLWVHGEWPASHVDHIDRDKKNNKLSNLRLATDSENKCNIAIRSDNSSGAKGVIWDKSRNKWASRVQMNGVIRTKRFVLFGDACKQSEEWRKELHREFAY